jgi:5-methylcytosine-specific restriction endonuclease McrA
MNKQRRERIERHKALKEWGRMIRARDGNKCQMCGETRLLNAHHIIPKELRELSFEPMNGISLCVRCHKWGMWSAHKNGFYFAGWLKINKPEQYKFLLNKVFIVLDEDKS